MLNPSFFYFYPTGGRFRRREYFMDHLIKIYGSTIPVPRVPFLCVDDYQYDDGDFLDYAFRCGLRKEKSRRGLLGMETDGVDLEARVPFLQAWLFFGTLQDNFGRILRTDFDPWEFICLDKLSHTYINSERLPE